MNKSCPVSGSEHVWGYADRVETLGKLQCILCGFLSDPEPTKRQSTEQGDFSGGFSKMQARKVLEFTSFDPEDQNDTILSQQRDSWQTRQQTVWEVQDAVEHMLTGVMEEGNTLRVTIEVVEDE